ILRPLPHIPAHVEGTDPTPPGHVAAHIDTVRVVLPTDRLLIDIGVASLISVAPGINARLRAARRVFPFRFGGQTSSPPAGVGVRSVPRDTHTRLLRARRAEDDQRPVYFLGLDPLPTVVRPIFLVRIAAAVNKLLVRLVGHFVLIEPEALADTDLVLRHL